MKMPGRDGDDIPPAAHVPLAVCVGPHGNHRPVRLEAHGMTGSGGDGDDVSPAAHIALAVCVGPHGNHRPVRLEAHGMTGSGGDGDDILPAAHIALAVIKVPGILGSDNRPVLLEANRMPAFGGDGDHILPFAHVTLAILVGSHGGNRPVRPEPHGMRASGTQGLPLRDLSPKLETTFPCVAVVLDLIESQRRLIRFPFCQQGLGFRIGRRVFRFGLRFPRLSDPLSAVPVPLQRLESGNSLVILPGLQQGLRFGVSRRVFRFDLRFPRQPLFLSDRVFRSSDLLRAVLVPVQRLEGGDGLVVLSGLQQGGSRVIPAVRDHDLRHQQSQGQDSRQGRKNNGQGIFRFLRLLRRCLRRRLVGGFFGFPLRLFLRQARVAVRFQRVQVRRKQRGLFLPADIARFVPVPGAAGAEPEALVFPGINFAALAEFDSVLLDQLPVPQPAAQAFTRGQRLPGGVRALPGAAVGENDLGDLDSQTARGIVGQVHSGLLSEFLSRFGCEIQIFLLRVTRHGLARRVQRMDQHRRGLERLCGNVFDLELHQHPARLIVLQKIAR